MGGVDLADLLQSAGQRVQVPCVLVLGLPQAEDHRRWALLTRKVTQVPRGRGEGSGRRGRETEIERTQFISNTGA